MRYYSLTEKEISNSGKNSPREFLKLDRDTQDKLLDWISRNLIERKAFNHQFSSYGMKHMLPFYVTNGAFKGAMLNSGYRVWDKSQMNWRFNVYIRKGRKR